MDVARNTLEVQVARIRSALLVRHGYTPGTQLPREFTGSPLDDVQRLATINAHWGITSDVPIVGRFIVLARRIQRILLRWYMNPVVEQQNAFNEAVSRALFEMQQENEALRSQLRQAGVSGESDLPTR